MSPWVVTLDALEPFLVFGEPQENPQPLPYLRDSSKGAYDIKLEAYLKTAGGEHILTRTNLKHMYWSFKQQLAHHTVNGCNMRTGDLCGSGTISGDASVNLPYIEYIELKL